MLRVCFGLRGRFNIRLVGRGFAGGRIVRGDQRRRILAHARVVEHVYRLGVRGDVAFRIRRHQHDAAVFIHGNHAIEHLSIDGFQTIKLILSGNRLIRYHVSVSRDRHAVHFKRKHNRRRFRRRLRRRLGCGGRSRCRRRRRRGGRSRCRRRRRCRRRTRRRCRAWRGRRHRRRRRHGAVLDRKGPGNSGLRRAASIAGDQRNRRRLSFLRHGRQRKRDAFLAARIARTVRAHAHNTTAVHRDDRRRGDCRFIRIRDGAQSKSAAAAKERFKTFQHIGMHHVHAV